ncbi:amidase [Bordetella genomosp. 13]|uniref:amidase n=1 Tax=Bordetella genomosp. 13 TaxID=463040 RepID=UPI0011A5F91B|nr:amidase [Bordetella genomosp. 13]
MTQDLAAPGPTWALTPQDALAASRRDGDVRAWTHLAAEAGAALAGPLAGVAFGVKDVIDVAGMPTRCGSEAIGGDPRDLDAACVAQLRQAGAVPIGKTVTAEFAYVTPGPTRNPHHLGHTPGGSSSGSAAAVAAGMVELALGTQTGGSIIRPAAFCGVIGFKPTFGRVHRQGMHVLCDTLDTIGWFTRTLEQAAATARVFLGATGEDTSIDRAPRVALLPARALGTLSPAAQAALDNHAALLREHGAHIIEPDCDADLIELLRVHGDIMLAELARGLLSLRMARPEGPTPALRNAMDRGLSITPVDYADLQQARTRLAQRWQDRFADVDVILTPSAPSEAPAGFATTGSSVFNRVWSLLGWPCVHVPTGKTPAGLPVGVQCVALPDRDLELLAWTQWMQRLPMRALAVS